MKKSRLQRSSSLSGSRGKKRGPSMAGFWAAVTENGRKPCEICGGWAWGDPDAHHYIKEQRLPDAAKIDPRVGVCLCRGCHGAVHSAHPPAVPRPPLLDEFLEDHGLLESGRPNPKRQEAA